MSDVNLSTVFFLISENKHFSKFLAETLAKDPDARADVLQNDEVGIRKS